MPKRIDANQNEIVKKLRQCGMKVMIISHVGSGCPDLAVGWRDLNCFLELKDGSKPASQQALTADEREWHANWGGQVAIVRNFEEAYNAVLLHAQAHPARKTA